MEIQVKSVLNQVQGMPFKWSVNPYRGCAHACVYCAGGDTPILMGDGTLRPLGDLSAGAEICGTVADGGSRRSVKTRVLAHWVVRKPAYRVRLENDSELIASGDHRFLSDHGWAFVTGSEHGWNRRPVLTEDSRLIGVDAPLRVTSVEPFGTCELFDITTGTGDFIANGVVSHNCYARLTHWYLDQGGGNDWSSRIFVKMNAPEVLRRELARPTWRREQVHIGTATDPYQPAEGAYRITRQILEALRDGQTPMALVTKSTMVIRDRDVLRQLAEGPGALVLFSFTTVDPALGRELEPDVPPPQRRLEAMRTLTEAGIPTGVLLAPVLPGITDGEEQLAAVVAAAKEYGASALFTNTLYLGDVTREVFFEYLEHKRPDLVPEYERLYRGKYAPRATQQRIQQVVAALRARMGITGAPRKPDPYRQTPRAESSPPKQLRLL